MANQSHSYKIDLTEDETKMVDLESKLWAEYQAAECFEQLGLEEPSRQKEWLHDHPVLIDVFDPAMVKDYHAGKIQWDDVYYASAPQPYIDEYASIARQVLQIEWRYPCFAVADEADQQTYTKLIERLTLLMPESEQKRIMEKYFEAEWYGAGLRDFPNEVINAGLRKSPIVLN